LLFFSFSAAGDELSWLTPSLGVWYGGLLQRDSQYRTWLNNGRPHSYWMTGFFNPQGFLTAVQQEITRSHKQENWALDSVVLHADITDLQHEHVKSAPKVRLSTSFFTFLNRFSFFLLIFPGWCLCSWALYGWCFLVRF
jgi:hypothetical protein